MIYAEGDSEESLQGFIEHLQRNVGQTRDEWDMKIDCYRMWFPATTPVEQAMTRLFSLQVQDIESCSAKGLS
jgi:hypothetical protein